MLDSELNNYFRANRAQYSEVSFQGIVEEDVVDISLPSVQGEAEDKGMFDLLSAQFELMDH